MIYNCADLQLYWFTIVFCTCDDLQLWCKIVTSQWFTILFIYNCVVFIIVLCLQLWHPMIYNCVDLQLCCVLHSLYNCVVATPNEFHQFPATSMLLCDCEVSGFGMTWHIRLLLAWSKAEPGNCWMVGARGPITISVQQFSFPCTVGSRFDLFVTLACQVSQPVVFFRWLQFFWIVNSRMVS